MPTGTIFDIQRFALHDGPGIRTTVFFKGCSNSCGWCHNPESFDRAAQLQFYPLRCALCGKCADVCARGAHSIDGGRHGLDRGKCSLCGMCAEACYNSALVITGRDASVGEVFENVMEDAAYYETSGGGVTLSGGEPVLQHEFALCLLKMLKAKGVHTNIQTAGNYPFEYLEKLLPYLDMVMFDVKGISDFIYERHIRGDKSLMLGNLLKLDGVFNAPIIVRTPVIEGVNATGPEIEAITHLIKPLKNLESYRLIPYHGLGRAKYDALGEPYGASYATPAPEKIAELETAAAKRVPVYNLSKGYIGED